jgi:V/A-type H+-transporting ATPase subunit K
MDVAMNLGMLGAGLTFTLSALGSGIGVLICGLATIGVWKKTYLANKPASMIMLAFTGNPLTQTFYGFILMNAMMGAAVVEPEKGLFFLIFGIASGVTILITAIVQGKLGAVGVDALGETGKGFAQYYTVMGIAETVALFTMVFGLISL